MADTIANDGKVIVDVVYSPDDGGYYLERFDFDAEKSETSKLVYDTRDQAAKAYRQDRVQWER